MEDRPKRYGANRPGSTPPEPKPTNYSNAIARLNQALTIIEDERRQGRLEPRDEALFLVSVAQAEAFLAVADRISNGVPLSKETAALLNDLSRRFGG